MLDSPLTVGRLLVWAVSVNPMFSPSASKWVTVPYDIAAGVGTVYDRDLILAVSEVGAGGTLCAGLQSPTEMTVCNRAGRTALP